MNVLFNLNYWAVLELAPVVLLCAVLEKCIRALISAVCGFLHIPHLDVKSPLKAYYNDPDQTENKIAFNDFHQNYDAVKNFKPSPLVSDISEDEFLEILGRKKD